jgi:CheY-like chemotaxis protein
LVAIRKSDGADGAERHSAARILIADDTLSGRELVRSILEDCGHEVAEAEDGEQVIAIAILFDPHLVILDIHMPKLDGWATAAALRNIPAFASIPIVALSAASVEVLPDRIARAGFTSYLVKPIGPRRLRECVASLLPPNDHVLPDGHPARAAVTS